MKWIQHPNLPETRVSLALVSGEYPYILSALERHGVEVIPTTAHHGLPEPVRFHADMQYFYCGNGQILSACDLNCVDLELKKRGMEVVQTENSPEPFYPKDVLLNAALLGERLIANTKTMDTALQTNVQGWSVQMLHTNQGYARCSVCIVDESAIATADPDIARVADADGMDVLRIDPGGISLPGYPYGLIGGCAGLIEKRKIAFTGNILKHPDGREIVRFMEKHSVEVVCLGDGMLLDVGGMVQLMESP